MMEKIHIEDFVELSKLLREIENVFSYLKRENNLSWYVELIRLLKELGIRLGDTLANGRKLEEIHLQSIDGILSLIENAGFLKEVKSDVTEAMLGVLSDIGYSPSLKDSPWLDKSRDEVVNMVMEAVQLLKTKIIILRKMVEIKKLLSSTEVDIDLIKKLNDELVDIVNLLNNQNYSFELDERIFKQLMKLFDRQLDYNKEDSDFVILRLNDLRDFVSGVLLILRWQQHSKPDWIPQLYAEKLLGVLQTNSDGEGSKIKGFLDDVRGFNAPILLSGGFMGYVLDKCEKELDEECLKYLLISYKLQVVMDVLKAGKFSSSDDWSFLDIGTISEEEWTQFIEFLNDEELLGEPTEFKINGQKLYLIGEDILEIARHLYFIINHRNNGSNNLEDKTTIVVGILRNIASKMGVDFDQLFNAEDKLYFKRVELNRLEKKLTKLRKHYNNLKGKEGSKSSGGRQMWVKSELNRLSTEIKALEKRIEEIEEEIKKLSAQ